MARRSKVLVEVEAITSNVNNNVETLEASKEASLTTDPFWDNVKMADFKFAMRQFANGSEQGTALSWRGLVCKLLALKDEDSNKQVFITVFESDSRSDSRDYKITLRMRVILSENGVGYSLCRILEALENKQPQGVFVRVDIRDTISVSETLTLLRTRFPVISSQS